MSHHDHLRSDDLQPVIDQLRANRPQATPLELDAVKQRVLRRRGAAPAGRGARSATFMKSRLAILGMLVAGMLLSTTGAGMAISGLSGDDASVSQYAAPDNDDAGGGGGGGGVLPDQGGGQGGVAGDDAGGGGAGEGDEGLQPSRQVEAGADSGGGDELPFTGLAAIPILLGGVALLSTGLILRRRTHGEQS
jgi:hypothetical protein